MPLETALLGYAGLALFAAVRGRTPHRRVEPPFLTSRPAMRIVGIVLLSLSLVTAFTRYGPYQGMVAWLGLLSLSGIALVLLLSWWRVGAVAMWLPAAIVGLSLALVKAVTAA
ncbi:MAG: DUF3325 family protein [Pseudomonadota bacterium]